MSNTSFVAGSSWDVNIVTIRPVGSGESSLLRSVSTNLMNESLLWGYIAPTSHTLKSSSEDIGSTTLVNVESDPDRYVCTKPCAVRTSVVMSPPEKATLGAVQWLLKGTISSVTTILPLAPWVLIDSENGEFKYFVLCILKLGIPLLDILSCVGVLNLTVIGNPTFCVSYIWK